MKAIDNPAEMSFATLMNYYYDNGAPNLPNWVFPIQLTRATRQDKKKPDKSWMDSQPIQIIPVKISPKFEEKHE